MQSSFVSHQNIQLHKNVHYYTHKTLFATLCKNTGGRKTNKGSYYISEEKILNITKQLQQLLHPKFHCFKDFFIANAWSKHFLKIHIKFEEIISFEKSIEFLLPGVHGTISDNIT